MGTEAAWVPAVVSLVGAAATAKAQDDALRSADEEAAQGIRLQSGHQRQADERISQEVGKLQNSSPEASQRQATEAFMDQLRRTRSQAHGTGTVGATSDTYNADSAQAATDVDNYGAARADVLGRINAPGLQRTAEQISLGRAGTDLGLIGRAANADQFLTQLRQQNVRANPWLVAGGQVAQGVGSGMASSGNYGGTTSVPKGGVKRYDAPVSGFTRGKA